MRKLGLSPALEFLILPGAVAEHYFNAWGDWFPGRRLGSVLMVNR